MSESLTKVKDDAAKAGNIALRTTAKLLINSAYGRFGSTFYENSSSIVTLKELTYLETIYEVDNITHLENDFVIVNYKNMPKKDLKGKVDDTTIQSAWKNYTKIHSNKNTNLALASAITAEGRVMLYNLFMEVNKRGGTMIYCDTDSVFAHLPESPFNKPFGPFI